MLDHIGGNQISIRSASDPPGVIITNLNSAGMVMRLNAGEWAELISLITGVLAAQQRAAELAKDLA